LGISKKVIVSIIYCQLLALSTNGYAEETSLPEVDSLTLENITVTTRKRNELLQKVPSAVTAFTAKDIKDRNIHTIEDLSMFTPGFTYTSVPHRRLGNPVVRGQNTVIGESNVGIFIDGVYQGSRGAMDSLLGDNLERVEITKGPQNALYGRNTFAGTINYISKRPSNKSEGNADVTIGNKGRQEFQLAHSGSIIENKLFYRVNGMHASFDGFYDNDLTGGELDDKQSNTYALSLMALPSDNVEMTLRVAVEDTNDGDDATQYITNNSGFTANFFAPGAAFNDFQIYSGDIPSLTSGFAVTPGHHQRDKVNSSFRLDWDLEQLTFTSITGYNDLSLDYLFDSDYEARNLAQSILKTEQEEFSQEFRLSSELQDIRWLAGVYFYGSDSDIVNRNEFVPGAILGPVATLLSPNVLSESTEKIHNLAVFGSVDFNITTQLKMTLAGRYTYERKKVSVNDTNLVTLDSSQFSQSAVFNHFTPKVALDYAFTDDVMLYASVAKAVKSGGFNTSTLGGRVPTADERTYDSEKSINYEIGLKSSWLNNRLTSNLSAFYIKWDDQIVRQLGSANAILNANAGESTSKGIEFELAAKPAKNWDLRAGVSYTNAKFDKYTYGALTIADLNPVLDGVRMQYVSKLTANASVQYIKPLSANLKWQSRVDALYQSDQLALAIHGAPIIPDRTVVNLQTSLEHNKYTVKLWAKNVFDNDEISHAVASPNPANAADYGLLSAGYQQFQVLVQAPQRRTFGITAGIKF